jgi:type II secretory ATPase GspE/PulE/Tfp pilus assembly ATPase PilB-like protein
MTCDEVRALLTDYANGKLDAENRERIDVHASRCPDCQRNLCAARLIDDPEVADKDSAAIIRIAYTIIEQAIVESAKEVRIEPEANGIRVSYEIRGVLQESMPLPKYIQDPLFSRLKTMGNLDSAETSPQRGGVIHISYRERDFDVRISCTPTEHGEQIVMRLPVV